MSKIRNCVVKGCFNKTTENPDLSFFSIPTDGRRDEWLRLISRQDMKGELLLSNSARRWVCEEHFSSNDIMFTNKRKFMKKTAMPSQYLPLPEIPIEYDSKENIIESTSSTSAIQLASKLTQTDNFDEDSIVLKSEDTSLEALHDKFYELCDKHLTKDLAALIKSNNTLKYKKSILDQDAYLQFCFDLYKKCPQAYNFFQNIYGLPNCGSRLLGKFMQTGTIINDTAMLTIKTRVDKMSAKEKYCSVLIGSIKLKANLCYNIKQDKIFGFQELDDVQSTELANKAVVVMIKGLFSNWKLPLCYVLVPQNANECTIHIWIYSLIKRLFDIGLNVRTLVSSIKEYWINAEIAVSIDNPFFLVNDRKVYHVFDANDLVKSARDCLMLYNIHFEDKVAKYEDIIKFFEEDRTKLMPYADRLTESHVNPKNKEKREAKLAIELMSEIVANGMWNYMQFELIKNCNIGTVEFVSIINNFYDTLNVSKQHHRDNERKVDSQLEKMLSFFQNIKVVNPNNGEDITEYNKFVNGIVITIKAISMLYKDLETEGHFLPTRNLHKKMLENFISKLVACVKRKSAKLTTIQFATEFKKLFFKNFSLFMQKGSAKGEVKKFVAPISQIEEEIIQNGITKEDLYKISMESIQPTIKISNAHSIRTNETDKKITKDEYGIIDTADKHSSLLISGYLLNMSKNVHKNCHILKHYLYSHVYETEKEIGDFRKYNQYVQNNVEDLLEAPSDSFIKFVEEMDAKVVTAFTNKHLCPRLVDSLCRDIENINFTPPCPCFPKNYVVTLFVRMKVFYTIRLNNKLFKTNKLCRKYFTVPRL